MPSLVYSISVNVQSGLTEYVPLMASRPVSPLRFAISVAVKLPAPSYKRLSKSQPDRLGAARPLHTIGRRLCSFGRSRGWQQPRAGSSDERPLFPNHFLGKLAFLVGTVHHERGDNPPLFQPPGAEGAAGHVTAIDHLAGAFAIAPDLIG